MATSLVKIRRFRVKSSLKTFLRAFAIYLLIATIVRGGGLIFHSYATYISTHYWFEYFTLFADEYLKKHGDRYDALAEIDYYRYLHERWEYTSTSEEDVFYAMYSKYPDMREIYISYLYDGITDVTTEPFKRNKLLWLLSEVSFEDFKDMPDSVPYANIGPYEYAAVANVEKWLKKRNRERLAEVQASIKREFSYAGPEESLEKECGGDVK